MHDLLSTELVTVAGGVSGAMCPPTDVKKPPTVLEPIRNANGTLASTPQEIQTAISAPSMSQQIIANTDKTLNYWETVNGIFGGAAIDAPGPNKW